MPKSDSTIGMTEETGDRGVPALAVQKTTGAGISADGKYTPLQTDSSGNLRVNIAAGSSSGTEYADGAVRGTATGSLILGDDGTNVQSVKVDSDGNLQVDIVSGGVAGVQFADGEVRGTATGTLAMGDDGTNIQSVKVDAAGELQVDVLTLPALPAGANNIGDVDIVSGTITTVSTVTNLSQQGGVAIALNTGTRSTGTQRVTIATDDLVPVTGTITAVTALTNALPAGTNKIGDVDIAPRTTGGWSVANFTSGDTYTALTATAQVIKASAGKFGGYYIYNPNSAATYVLVYNIAAASVTVGTSTALLVFCIPATSGANLEILAGIPFSNAGWSIAAATTGGGNTAPSTALEAMIWYV